jgi:NitT/TauT family transport system ATP-binding protein
MSALEIKIARKSYFHIGQDPLAALSDLRFKVDEGEFVSVVGPSGCGKTTLLNLIGGLDSDVDGSVLVNGVAPEDGPVTGHMFQTPRLMPWLTVRDNISLVEKDSTTNGDRVDELLAEMGLADFSDTYPAHLSGGMRRRVALARAFLNEPGLLLLDEPFLSLDAPVANHLRRMLLDLCGRRSATVLFVTHDLREALYLADRVLFMSGGPGTIVLDLPVDLSRPREPESEDVERLRISLLKDNPQLLAGLVKEKEI